MKKVDFCSSRSHFDLTSPSLGGTTTEIFPCPLCIKTFNSAPDLELHVNIEHRDILSPASPPTHACPVCGIAIDSDSNVSITFNLHHLAKIAAQAKTFISKTK